MSACALPPSEGTGTSEDDLSAADTAIAARLPGYADTERVFANEGIGVVRTPGGGILLRARSEARASAVLDAILTLRGQGAPRPALERRPSGWFEAKIDHVLPPYLAQTLGKVVDDNSVQSNCWGHSMAAAGIVEGVKELSAAGYTTMLASPLCEEIPASEGLRPGDVVSLRAVAEKDGAFSFDEVHTAVALTDDVWSSKNGAGAFVIADARAVLAQYLTPTTPPECWTRARPTRDRLLRCKSVLVAHRCQATATYRAASRAATPHYDELARALEPYRWEIIHQQRGSEIAGDDVVPKGSAYVSRFVFDPVSASYLAEGEEIPAPVARRLASLRSDPKLGAKYSLDAPRVPELPFVYDPEGDGYERLDRGYRNAEAALKTSVERVDLDPRERVLIDLLYVEIASSQLSTLGERPGPRASRLLAPSRRMDAAAR